MEAQLQNIDFAGKSVLDVGAWDGAWSFFAERRGAARVLATDDLSQNWASGSGIHIAKAALGSRIEIDQSRSIYRLAEMGQTFDIILCFGVYYHLHAPFEAFAQLRHCCHEDTLILVEGSITRGVHPNAAYYNFPDHTAEWLPTVGALRQIFRATYLQELSMAALSAIVDPIDSAIPVGSKPPAPTKRPSPWWKLWLPRDPGEGSNPDLVPRSQFATPRDNADRIFARLRPRSGPEELHVYPPPCGLHAYDPRFSASTTRHNHSLAPQASDGQPP